MNLTDLKFHQDIIATVTLPCDNGSEPEIIKLPGIVQGITIDRMIYVSHAPAIVPPALWPTGARPAVWVLRLYSPDQISPNGNGKRHE